MILISIVVPFYRIKKEIIKECVNSIINQTYKNIEAFLVDDGNTDGTAEYLDELAAQYSCLSVIHQENRGVSVARNAGIQAAKGDYIVFLDGDDCLAPYCIETFASAIREKDVDIIYAEHVVFKDKCVFKKRINCNAHIIEDKTVVLRSVLSSGVSKKKGLHGAPWGKAFKQSFIENNALKFDSSLPRSQDNEFNFRAIQYAEDIAYLSEEIYGYRESGQSAMTRYRTDSKEIQEKYLDKIIADAEQFHVLPLVKHDIDVVTMIKFFDICNTFLLHRDRSCSWPKKVESVRNVLRETKYKKALDNVNVNDFKGAPKIYILLLKNHLYFLYCVAHFCRRLIKRL
jgi:glycosyltransferase involved in cell wall biosynthesis